jgi:hypothetical protein
MAMQWQVVVGCGGTFALRLTRRAEAEVCGGWAHGNYARTRNFAGGV